MLGDKLKELRNKTKKSQSQVAHELNTTQTTYSKWEINVNEPDTKTLIQLAKYFNVTIDYLLDNHIDWNTINDYKETTKILVLESVRGNVPLEKQSIIGYDYINSEIAQNNDYFFLKANEDLKAFGIKKNSLLLVKKQNFLKNKDIGIVQFNGDDAICRKFMSDNKYYYLLSDNLNDTPITIEKNEFKEENDCHIIGKVVEIRIKL